MYHKIVSSEPEAESWDYTLHINVFLHICIIVSSEPEVKYWDSGMIIGVVAMAILLTLTASLLAVFIFD